MSFERIPSPTSRIPEVHVPQRENAIVNRLDKTKAERDVDHEQEKIDRQKAESAVRRAAAVEQKKAKQEIARQRAAEKEAKSYDRLFEGMDEVDDAPQNTIVIVVNVAIAISTDVYNKIDGVGQVGGIIGASVSASFLFIIGLANSIILYQIIRERRRRAQNQAGEGDDYHRQLNEKFFMMRILGPVTRFVDRPWKMYPVGILFGFGFDTASSIALLAVTAIAKRDSNGHSRISHGDVIILPLLFTAGMTLVDSLDSILMLYSYAGVTERGLSPFRRVHPSEHRDRGSKPPSPRTGSAESIPSRHSPSSIQQAVITQEGDDDASVKAKQDIKDADLEDAEEDEREEDIRKAARLKENTMSKLSIILTLLSILVAFSISLITIMGLIGDNCRKCREAAEADDGGGLAGRWWRGWAKASETIPDP
ncbi:hypothetical protein FRB90_002508 [Tulasnella sp. 427]|nr:hypothetical protein FRB90_002508 [Tulasnella sp. 427]